MTTPLTLDAEEPSSYLGADEVIETGHPAVVALSDELRRGHATDTDFARAAYTWVRDNVAHSVDAQDPRVTITASEVLTERVGLCYAKSHLLAALLRSQGVPAGLCYQRLGSPEDGYAVHGLVAVHLDGAWHRQDPRGNRPGVDAQFSVEGERLAWVADAGHGELDYPRLYRTAAPEVLAALRASDDVLACSLPSRLG